MAETEGPSSPKKTKQEVEGCRNGGLLNSLDAFLTDKMYSVWMLKVVLCDAKFSEHFSQAKCHVERSFNSTENPSCKEVFCFASLFQRGIYLIQNSLQADKHILTSKLEDIGLLRLKSFQNNREDVAEKLDGTLFMKEAEFAAVLIHHFLHPLSVNRGYTIDSSYRLAVGDRRCPCQCGKRIEGVSGDTSIGIQDYWHGTVDVLMGPVAVDIRVDAEETEDGVPTSLFDCDEEFYKAEHQIVPETIVFGCLQKRLNQGWENSLIPTIAVSKKVVKIYFFDADRDIIVESAPFDLLDVSGKKPIIPDSTVFAVWLALNYQLFCTGLTDEMVKKNFTADFLKAGYGFYKEDVVMGDCAGEGKYDSDLVRPGGVSWKMAPFEFDAKRKSEDTLED